MILLLFGGYLEIYLHLYNHACQEWAGHVALEVDKMRYLVTELCRWNDYTMGKCAGKLESSQKQNRNILTQLSGIHKVRIIISCPTFYLHTHTYSTMSVRCSTKLAVSVCTMFAICSCTGEGRQKNMAPTEDELWTYARMGLCDVTKFQQISCILQLPRKC